MSVLTGPMPSSKQADAARPLSEPNAKENAAWTDQDVVALLDIQVLIRNTVLPLRGVTAENFRQIQVRSSTYCYTHPIKNAKWQSRPAGPPSSKKSHFSSKIGFVTVLKLSAAGCDCRKFSAASDAMASAGDGGNFKMSVLAMELNKVITWGGRKTGKSCQNKLYKSKQANSHSLSIKAPKNLKERPENAEKFDKPGVTASGRFKMLETPIIFKFAGILLTHHPFGRSVDAVPICPPSTWFNPCQCTHSGQGKPHFCDGRSVTNDSSYGLPLQDGLSGLVWMVTVLNTVKKGKRNLNLLNIEEEDGVLI
ncbi:hypothetical protein GGX14DRAFT_387360 [Mycena pura]|uniref:Uncharacterized protein n=1 Tax=Mycena pura TaxID=153505 RepID=A0AAD6YNX8_9AGAR|nr:hypothetical protein GGX14DRAFT_387360 [Mycena pura]